MPQKLSKLTLMVLPWLVLAGFMFLWRADLDTVHVLRLKLFDFYQQTWPREAPENAPVVIIDIDEKSLAEIGQWPWPRTTLGKVVEQSFAYGAKALGFDAVFAEPDRSSPENAMEEWGLEDQTRRELANLPSHDRIFTRAMERAGNVVLGFAIDFSQGFVPEEDIDLFSTVSGDVNAALPWVPHVPALVRNLEDLEYAAPGLGWFGYIPDPDNIIRKVPLLLAHNNVLLAPLSLELLKLYLGEKAPIVPVMHQNGGLKGLAVGETFIPTDRNGMYWLHFRKFSKNNYISAVDLLKGNVPEGFLKDKMAIVGVSAKGLLDLRATPLDAAMPGVDVHAQFIETALSNDYLSRPYMLQSLEMWVTLLLGALLIFCVERFGAIRSGALALLVAGGIVVGGLWAFYRYGLLVDVLLPLITLVGLYMVHNFIKYVQEEASRKAIRSAFGHYLSPELVNILTRDPDRLKLGGEEKEMTMLFSDIRGFTTLSEGFGPEELTAFINAYLTPMTDIIMQQQGTIDKYMGDAVMAFWNAPLDIDNHAEQACRSACLMLEKLNKLNEKWQIEGLPPIDIGIGINTGKVSVGNMGSDQRFDYTVLGDAVNLASRLEGACKMYGVKIVVSETTVSQVDTGFFIPLDLVIVKGKTEPVEVFELVRLGQPTPEENMERDTIAALIKNFRSRNWDEALNLCAEVKHHPALRDLYITRINEYKKNPPPPEWNGAVERREK